MDVTRTKRVIYFVLGIVVFLTIGFVVYQYLLSRVPATPGDEGQTGIWGGITSFFRRDTEDKDNGRDTQGLPRDDEFLIEIPFEERSLVQLTTFPVVSPWLNSDENRVLFYKKEGGDLYSSDFNGDVQEKISSLTILGIMEALWSPKNDRAAVFYLDGENYKSFIHHGTSGVAILPQNIKGFSWSPDGNSLGYLEESGDRISLVIADQMGRNSRTVFTTALKDSLITWADADTIAFQTAPSAFAPGHLFAYSRGRGTFTKIAGPMPGLMSVWSPDGSRALITYSVRGGRELEFKLLASSGTELFGTTLRTIASKCVFADSSLLYCGVPVSLENKIWPDDYLRGEVNSRDRLVSVNLEDKNIQEIPLVNLLEFDISEITITKNKEFLFFVDRRDGTLWRVKLGN